VIVLLVRHGRAGERSKWEGDDRLRPLDKKGHRQAEGLVELLRPYAVDRILSSPYVRCVQTVEPLAGARELPLEEAEELAEGRERADVLGLLEMADAECPVLSTHGDVVVELLGEELKKGETQVLELAGGKLRQRERLPRPG
jgi:phosphohistidine phosphatase SixA